MPCVDREYKAIPTVNGFGQRLFEFWSIESQLNIKNGHRNGSPSRYTPSYIWLLTMNLWFRFYASSVLEFDVSFAVQNSHLFPVISVSIAEPFS